MMDFEPSISKTALLAALKRNALYAAQDLIKSGNCDLNAMDEEGDTALLYVACIGNIQLVSLLVDGGADVNAKNKLGGTALMYAAFLGHFDVVKYLVENKADVNAKNKLGETVFKKAVFCYKQTVDTDKIRGYLITKGVKALTQTEVAAEKAEAEKEK